MEEPNTLYKVDFIQDDTAFEFHSFRTLVYADNWQLYDYVDYTFQIRVATIDSITAYTSDGTYIPIELHYLLTDSSGEVLASQTVMGGSSDDGAELFTWYDTESTMLYLSCRLDLTALDRVNESSVFLRFAGTYDPSCASPSYFGIQKYTGQIKTSFVNAAAFYGRYCYTQLAAFHNNWLSRTSAFFNSVEEHFVALGDRIEAALNPSSDSADNAIDTQAQTNEQINTQLSQSVGDWNNHAAELTSGTELAIENSVPALSFLSDIAQSIFSGIGWFGTVYLFVGLLSVYFLILNKSGIANRFNK